MLTMATTSCRAMMQPNRVTTGHDRRGAVGRFTMSREEEEVLLIAKPPFYPSRRSFDCLAACARGYFGRGWQQCASQEASREASARHRITTKSPGDTP